MMLATTGAYPGSGGRETYAVPPSLPVGVARSLVAALTQTPDVRAVTPALARATPRIRLKNVGVLVHLERFFARSLDAATHSEGPAAIG
jgi:hypothetical protein